MDHERTSDEGSPPPGTQEVPPFDPDPRLVALLEQGPNDDPERLFRKVLRKLYAGRPAERS